MQVSSYCPPGDWADAVDFELHSGSTLRSLRAASSPRLPVNPAAAPSSRPLPSLAPSTGPVGPGDYRMVSSHITRRVINAGRFSKAPRFVEKEEEVPQPASSDDELLSVDEVTDPQRKPTTRHRRLLQRKLRLGRAHSGPIGLTPTFGYTGPEVASMALGPPTPTKADGETTLHFTSKSPRQQRRKPKRLVQSDSCPTFRTDYTPTDMNLGVSRKRLHDHPSWEVKDPFSFW
mmetsp:Transcript_73954/g.176011  ORF Transcript_73954/g.176011 Transcript_73954/m.176011 type:complete len:232 (+) Transcript_73954:48-743(+)